MILVTCAIIEREGQLLVAQRSRDMSLPMKWEFPGGKMEAGEDAESCIVREIREELNLEISITGRQQLHLYEYPEKTILLIPFLCEITGGELELTEHHAVLWAGPDRLVKLDWAEADLGILDHYLNS